MGWLFAYDRGYDRKALIADLRKPSRFVSGEIVRSVAVGNNHWYIAKSHKGELFIGLDLMRGGGRDGGWGYKDLCESMGPCEVNCPLSFLDQAPAPDSQYAAGWREKVREYHAGKKAKKVPAQGMVVEYGGHQYELRSPAAPRKGWHVKRVSDGQAFRMNARQLSQSAVAA